MRALVSILMPMKNAELYVADTIKAILSQSFNDFELIVIDDKSSDSSRVIVEKFSDKRIKVYAGEGAGISSAFNLALSVSEGELIVRCDADDIYPKKRLETQVDFLKNNLSYGAVCGSFSSLDSKGKLILDYDCGAEEESVTKELLMGVTRTHYCTFAVRKEILDAVGGCRDYFVTAEDIDLQFRIAEQCEVFYVPTVFYHYRLHDSSIIHSQSTSKRKFYDEQAHHFLVQRQEIGADDLDRGVRDEPPADDGLRKQCDVQIQGNLLGLAWKQHAAGEKVRSLQTGLKACMVKPIAMGCWKSLIMLIIKQGKGGN